jgi:arylsulfatase A-like enzyme
VAWLPAEPAPEHAAEKERYLASLAPVDPAAAPSFVVILFDDLGWGDLSSYGSRLVETPRIDRAAAEGLRLTHAYSASPVCTPARAALLTGRYPVRSRTDRHVFFPDGTAAALARRAVGWTNELPRDEILLPEALAAAGYATGMVGKWHLGGRRGHQPNDFGFRSYTGVLWSHDMAPLHLFRDREIVQRDEREPGWLGGERDEDAPLGPGGPDASRLTADYTRAAIAFLEENRDRPFFLYLAHSFPHVPHYADPAFAGRSRAGLYGDVVEDLDRSTGEVLDALARLGLERRTLVIVTSDNGADYGGSTGGLRGRKGEVLEGGVRVPFVARWPGRVPAGRTSDAMAMGIDVFPTVLALAGLPPPGDRVLDGRDLGPLLSGATDRSPHELLFYFPTVGSRPAAVRDARLKLLTRTGDLGRDKPHLTRLDLDLEAHDLSRRQPEDAARLRAALDAFATELERNPRGWTASP